MRKWILLPAVGQVLDAASLAYFYLHLPAGWVGPTERNPVILLLMGLGGVELVILVKLAVTAFIVRRRDRYSRPVTRIGRILFPLIIPLAALSGFVGATFNSIAILALR
jgi:hypothetical protein